MLGGYGINISMDGKGSWLDNGMIERLWRSLKYECVYLHAFTGGHEARKAIGVWLSHYNENRPHLSFNGLTPDEVYYSCDTIEGQVAVGKSLKTFPQLNNNNADELSRFPKICSQNS